MQTILFKMKDTSGKDLNASFIGSKNEQMLGFTSTHLILQCNTNQEKLFIFTEIMNL